MLLERYDERIQRFNSYRSSSSTLSLLLTDFELPFIELICDIEEAMQSTYLRSAEIAFILLTIFIIIYFILQIIDSKGLDFLDDKRHWMDAWSILNIVLIGLEAISSTCFAVNID